jgi:hypothetical protein
MTATVLRDQFAGTIVVKRGLRNIITFSAVGPGGALA